LADHILSQLNRVYTAGTFIQSTIAGEWPENLDSIDRATPYAKRMALSHRSHAGRGKEKHNRGQERLSHMLRQPAIKHGIVNAIPKELKLNGIEVEINFVPVRKFGAL
jgi:hypothetical protein